MFTFFQKKKQHKDLIETTKRNTLSFGTTSDLILKKAGLDWTKKINPFIIGAFSFIMFGASLGLFNIHNNDVSQFNKSLISLQEYKNKNDLLLKILIEKSTFNPNILKGQIIFNNINKNLPVLNNSIFNVFNETTSFYIDTMSSDNFTEAKRQDIIIAKLKENNEINNIINSLQTKTPINPITITLAWISSILSSLSLIWLLFILNKKNKETIKIAKEFKNNQADENAIDDLVNQIEDLGDGNFSQSIQSNDKYMHSIANKIDDTRIIINDLVGEIKKTSQDILTTAHSTENMTQQLKSVSSQHNDKMGISILKVGKITADIDEVAKAAWLAQKEAEAARTASHNGEHLVVKSISKYEDIRNTIQETSKKFKKVGESAQAITEVTSLIKTITKKINILSLNAAIQAASSGESGREFTILAQEVQRLAADSEVATMQISQYIESVQADMNSAISSMETLTQEVVIGSQMNDDAGQALHQIEKISASVTEKISKAAEKIEEKSSEMVSLALDMKQLQSIVEKSLSVVNGTAKQVEELKYISEKLSSKVAAYKPENNNF